MSWWKFWEDDGDDVEESPDYYGEGLGLVREERYHEALTAFRLALREDPEDASPLEQMGVVYTRIGMTDEAIKAYRRALEREPDSPAAHYGVGFLLLKRGREEEAGEHLEAFLENAPPAAADDHVRHARETLDGLRAEGAPGESEAAADAGAGPSDADAGPAGGRDRSTGREGEPTTEGGRDEHRDG
jgi:Flp pilus assembly protein TadD